MHEEDLVGQYYLRRRRNLPRGFILVNIHTYLPTPIPKLLPSSIWLKGSVLVVNIVNNNFRLNHRNSEHFPGFKKCITILIHLLIEV